MVIAGLFETFFHSSPYNTHMRGLALQLWLTTLGAVVIVGGFSIFQYQHEQALAGTVTELKTSLEK